MKREQNSTPSAGFANGKRSPQAIEYVISRSWEQPLAEAEETRISVS